MGTAGTPSGRSGRIGAAVSSCQSHGAKASPGCRKPYSRPNLSRQCGPRGLDGCASAAQGDLMLYFFDVTVNDRISVDLIGTECSSAGEMREEAVHALISIAKDEMREEDEQEFRISVRHRTNKVYMGACPSKADLSPADTVFCAFCDTKELVSARANVATPRSPPCPIRRDSAYSSSSFWHAPSSPKWNRMRSCRFPASCKASKREATLSNGAMNRPAPAWW
jgi:hypothetical protein